MIQLFQPVTLAVQAVGVSLNRGRCRRSVLHTILRTPILFFLLLTTVRRKWEGRGVAICKWDCSWECWRWIFFWGSMRTLTQKPAQQDRLRHTQAEGKAENSKIRNVAKCFELGLEAVSSRTRTRTHTGRQSRHARQQRWS